MKKSLLREFIAVLLVEAKADTIKEKWKKKLFAGSSLTDGDVDTIIDHLNDHDPSPTKRYLEWMAKQMAAYVKDEEDNDGGWNGDLKSDWWAVVERFDKARETMEQKDINAYASVDELRAALAQKPTHSKSQLKKQTKLDGAVKLLEDEDHLFIYVTSKDAAVNYGSGTKWCITSKTERHFEKYDERGVRFYFLFQKKRPSTDPRHKIAYAVSPNGEVEAYDAEDNLFVPTGDVVRFEVMAVGDAERRNNV
jgi:hypothetical protein